jgi:hypothetical protein
VRLRDGYADHSLTAAGLGLRSQWGPSMREPAKPPRLSRQGADRRELGSTENQRRPADLGLWVQVTGDEASGAQLDTATTHHHPTPRTLNPSRGTRTRTHPFLESIFIDREHPKRRTTELINRSRGGSTL